MKLYKYIEKKYAIKMLQEGEILINTLYNLRQHEHKEIGDKNEGTKKSITNFPDGALIKDKNDWDSKDD